LLRADSGFFDEAILLALEALELPDIIAARFTNPLQAAVYRLTFQPFAPGLEVGELVYQAHRWTRARRLIVIREELARRPTARGREFFSAPGYRFQAVVTTLTAAPVDVWRTYNGRADTENRLKELKHAFGADGFCCGAILGTVGRHLVLRLSRPTPWQERFLAHLQRVVTWVPNCNAVGAPARNRALP
jgi:hypothetical protein